MPVLLYVFMARRRKFYDANCLAPRSFRPRLNRKESKRLISYNSLNSIDESGMPYDEEVIIDESVRVCVFTCVFSYDELLEALRLLVWMRALPVNFTSTLSLCVCLFPLVCLSVGFLQHLHVLPKSWQRYTNERSFAWYLVWAGAIVCLVTIILQAVFP